jgi:hypothetical protein
MTIFELIEEIEKVGGRLTVLDDEILVSAPKGALTDQLKEEIKRQKKQLLASEQWEFRKLAVPSQNRAGCLDVWMYGLRTDSAKAAFRLWFVREERTEQPPKPVRQMAKNQG